MWKCTWKCVYALCGFTQILVYYRMRRYTVKCEFPLEEKCMSADADLLSFKWIILPHVEIHTKVCVNPRRRKFAFPPMWKFTWDRAFPHVEIHQKLWISQRVEILIFWCISTCGNHEQKSEFSHVNLQADSWISAGKNVREYTIFRGFPHAEIHAEMWIPACGNTRGMVYYRMR